MGAFAKRGRISAKPLAEGSHVDIVFQAEINEWQKQKRLQLNLEDVRLTQ